MRRGAGLLLAFLTAAGAALAQSPSPRLTIDVPRDSSGAPRAPIVQATGLPGDPFFGAMRSGFPVRMGFSLQLWRDGRFFDHLEREAAWEAVVIRDPLTETFELLRSGATSETFADRGSLEQALATPFAVDLLPPRPRGSTFYYVAALTVQSLSVSELEEVERWLRGDLGPAITGTRDVNNALSRGARLLMIRMSGLPRRQIETRSADFRW